MCHFLPLSYEARLLHVLIIGHTLRFVYLYRVFYITFSIEHLFGVLVAPEPKKRAEYGLVRAAPSPEVIGVEIGGLHPIAPYMGSD